MGPNTEGNNKIVRDAVRYRLLRDKACMFYPSAEGCDSKEACLVVTGYGTGGDENKAAMVDLAVDEEMMRAGYIPPLVRLDYGQLEARLVALLSGLEIPVPDHWAHSADPQELRLLGQAISSQAKEVQKLTLAWASSHDRGAGK